MAFAKQFKHAYHDGRLVSATVEPHREISLTIQLDPVWNDGLDKECTVSLGDIKNFEDVAAFVKGLRPPDRSNIFLDEVLHLGWTPAGNVELGLARQGYIELVRPKVLEI
jgi:hypothetical protein